MSQKLLSELNLRCTKECNALLIPEHGIVSHSDKTSTTFYRCSNPLHFRRVKVVSVYNEELDGMVLSEVFEKFPHDDTFTELFLDEQAMRQIPQAQEV